MARRRIVLLAVVVLLLAVAGLVFDTLADAGAFRTLAPHGFEQCTKVTGFTGAEDLVFDTASGLAFISSTDFRAMEEGAPKPGVIFSWDVTAKGAPKPVPHDFVELHPHGLGLFVRDGLKRLFVVNHPTRTSSTVELFDLLEGPTLKHVRTVQAPEFVSLNDVAPVGPEHFYVTIDAGTRAGTFGRVVETFARMPWSGLGYFDGTKASVAVPGLRYANGVAVSSDGATVFVAETTGRRLLAFSRDASSGALTQRAALTAEAGLDNISIADDGALFIGAHPKMLEFLGHAKDPAHHSPSQVLRARYTNGAFELTDVALDDGSLLSGSSVAVPLPGGRTLVGSVFEPHVLDCQLH
ncbi:MAG: SMP-30/gluconolactonase/LRE family protein [Archangium sp.]|nr:SMP-30/gluconolactonase/LRE family protein [Archangium sp.]